MLKQKKIGAKAADGDDERRNFSIVEGFCEKTTQTRAAEMINQLLISS